MGYTFRSHESNQQNAIDTTNWDDTSIIPIQINAVDSRARRPKFQMLKHF